MAFQAIFFCISACSVQIVIGQCLPSFYSGYSTEDLLSIGGLFSSRGLESTGVIPTGFGGSALVTSGSGSRAVTCFSPIALNGLSVTSALDIIGELLVAGVLPFASAVAFEAVLPTSGVGTVAYGCGDGVIGIEGLGGGIGGVGNVAGISGINGGIGIGGIGGIVGRTGYGLSGACGCL